VDQALEQLDKKQLEEQMKTVADEITWVFFYVTSYYSNS
jgi:hypothetical protein